MIRRNAARRLRKDNEQRNHRERCDHQQLVIVNIGNDLRLPRNNRIQCSASGSTERVSKLCNRRVLKPTINRRDVRRDLGVIHLRIPRQQTVHDRNADARPNIA
jgi:hypothetical protein